MRSSHLCTLLLAATLSMPVAVAQSSVADIIFGAHSKADYIGQRMDGRKLKNGMGIQRLKDGAIYAGDFSEGKMTGTGMIISPEKSIDGAPGAAFYVGKFLNGKKERRGTLYAADGDILYQGSFVGDKPTQAYPMPTPPLQRCFVMCEIGDGLFWGEAENDVPSGFGLLLQNDGSIRIGTFRDGALSGMCITIYDENAWEVGQWSATGYSAFSSSQAQAERRTTFTAARREIMSEMWSGLLTVATQLMDTGVQIATAVKGKGEGGDGDAAGGSVASGKSLDYYLTQYRKWESRAKKCFESRVSKKVNAKTHMDARVASGEAQNLRSYQRLMRQVRLEAQKAGHHIVISTYENASF